MIRQSLRERGRQIPVVCTQSLTNSSSERFVDRAVLSIPTVGALRVFCSISEICGSAEIVILLRRNGVRSPAPEHGDRASGWHYCCWVLHLTSCVHDNLSLSIPVSKASVEHHTLKWNSCTHAEQSACCCPDGIFFVLVRWIPVGRSWWDAGSSRQQVIALIRQQIPPQFPPLSFARM